MGMRVLIHDYAGHPFQVQLSRALAARGHDVLHLYLATLTSPRGALARREDDPPTFGIRGLALAETLDKQNLIKRRLQEAQYGRILADEVEAWGPDVVVSGNNPLDAQAKLMKRCQKRGIRFVYWVQDLLGIAARRLLRKKIPVLGAVIGRYYAGLERRLLRASDALVLITEDFRPLMLDMDIAASRLHVIENWAPLDELPMRPKDTAWAREHGLADKICFLYSGTLGMKHNPNLLLQLALHFRNDPSVRLAVISEGMGAEWLSEKAAEHGLDNVLLAGYQPFGRMPDVLAAGDVLVAILEPDAGIFSVPSKVLTYLCAGRALLLAVPTENLAARIVAENNAGLLVSPNDTAGFVEAGAALPTNVARRESMSRNARRYAETHFNIETITDRFEETFSRA